MDGRTWIHIVGGAGARNRRRATNLSGVPTRLGSAAGAYRFYRKTSRWTNEVESGKRFRNERASSQTRERTPRFRGAYEIPDHARDSRTTASVSNRSMNENQITFDSANSAEETITESA